MTRDIRESLPLARLTELAKDANGQVTRVEVKILRDGQVLEYLETESIGEAEMELFLRGFHAVDGYQHLYVFETEVEPPPAAVATTMCDRLEVIPTEHQGALGGRITIVLGRSLWPPDSYCYKYETPIGSVDPVLPGSPIKIAAVGGFSNRTGAIEHAQDYLKRVHGAA